MTAALALFTAPLPWAPDQPVALATHEDFCFLVADAGNTLTRDDRITDTESIIGPLGVPNVETIALSPSTGVLCGANASTLGTINITTGQYTTVGSFGERGGPLGNMRLAGSRYAARRPQLRI